MLFRSATRATRAICAHYHQVSVFAARRSPWSDRGDIARAKSVVASDPRLDALHRQVEEFAILTIARRQPMAVDLREIVAAIRMAADLERVGDLAKNIAKRVAALNQGEATIRTMRGIAHMTSLALHQLHDVLDSFAERDPQKATSVWSRDDEIDQMYTSLFRELLTYMMEDPGTLAFGTHLLFCAKNIERMGDHATNIAEAVHYMIEGNSLGKDRPKADQTTEIKFDHNTDH